MNIPGIGEINLGINAGSINGYIAIAFWCFLIIAVVGGVGWYLYSSNQKKKVFVWPCTLHQIRENGTKKEIPGLIGGSFKRRDGVSDFKIKIPKTWKKKVLGYSPDFSKADIDGRLHFISIGDGALWQQCEQSLVQNIQVKETVKDGETLKEEIKTYNLLITPIPTDIKTITIDNIQKVRDVMQKDKVTVFTIGIIAFIVMAIAHLISLYIQTKIRCPVPA